MIFISSQREDEGVVPLKVRLFTFYRMLDWEWKLLSYVKRDDPGVKVDALDEKKVPGLVRETLNLFRRSDCKKIPWTHEWQKTSCDRKININVPINYHENNLGSWPRIYEIQSVFVVSASCDISIKVSSKHLLLLVFKVASARWKRGDNFCITLFWRKTQNDVRSFRSYIEFIEL